MVIHYHFCSAFVRTLVATLALLAGSAVQADPPNSDQSESPTGKDSAVDKVVREDDVSQKTATETSLDPTSESGATTVDEGILLRFVFPEGDVLRYRKSEIGELKATLGDKTESTVTRADQVRAFTIESVDEAGKASIRMKFESVRMSVRGNDGQPVIYHDRMKSSDVPRIFRATAYQVRRGPVDFVARPMGPAMDVEEAGRPNTEKSATHMDVAIPLPEGRVQVGDSWKSYAVVRVCIKEEVTRDIRLLTSWKLAAIDDGQAKITFSTSPLRQPRSPIVRGQLIDASPKGHVLMDIEAGRLTRRVIRNDKSVYHAAGPDTLLTSSRESIEELLPTENTVSRR